MFELAAVIKNDAAQQVSIVETTGRVLDVCILHSLSAARKQAFGRSIQ